jgi:integrase
VRTTALTYRDLVNNGTDPRAKNADAGPARITFQVVAEQWFQKYKGTWKEVALNRHSKSLTRDIYPFIADKPIDDITKADLLCIIHQHEALGHHDVAHRVFSRLKAIFEFAVGSSVTCNGINGQYCTAVGYLAAHDTVGIQPIIY